MGITLRQDLKWNTYIEKVRARSNTLFWMILRTFRSGDPKLLTDLYKTYIRPLAEYNTCTWSPYLRTDIREVENIQRRITRSICKRANIKFSTYEERLNILELESLQSRRIKNDLVFLYKIINGLVDMETSNILKFSNFGGYNLRRHTQHISRQHIAKTHCRNNFFSYRVISYWNKLEEEVISSPNLVNFKIKLKKLRFLL